ncbi:EscF/YscF/HrpA family type III secretion system needle major subunit [Paracidovorax citrulli]
MDWKGAIEAINNEIGTTSRAALDALQKAAASGESVDFLAAQAASANYTNVMSLQSALIKMLHDLVAGIVAKI